MNSLTSLYTNSCSAQPGLLQLCVGSPPQDLHPGWSSSVVCSQAVYKEVVWLLWEFTQQIGLGTIDFQTKKTKTALVSSYFVRELHYFSPTPILTLNITLVPFAQTVTFQNSFFVSVATLWNFLPDSVISARSLFSFKHALISLPFQCFVCLFSVQLRLAQFFFFVFTLCKCKFFDM